MSMIVRLDLKEDATLRLDLCYRGGWVVYRVLLKPRYHVSELLRQGDKAGKAHQLHTR